MTDEVQSNNANSDSELDPLSIYEVLTLELEQISAIAWTKLGLQPDFKTKKLTSNLQEARVAIDVCEFIAEKLESQLDDEDRRRIRDLIADLKANYLARAQGPHG